MQFTNVLDQSQGGLSPVNVDQFRAALGRISDQLKVDSLLGKSQGSFAHTDGIDVGLALFQKHVDGLLDKDLKSHLDQRRADGVLGSSGGGLGAGALRHIYNEVLVEQTPQTNGLSMFPVDTSVPLGKREHQVNRYFTRGSVRVWRGTDSNIPTVQLGEDSETFKVQYYITSIMWDIFEEMSMQFSDLGQLRILAEAARRIIEDFANQKIWYGDNSIGIYGVLNYPWVTRLVLSGNFYGTPSDTTATLDELARMVNYPHEASKSVFAPNKVAMSPRMYHWLARTKLKDSSTLTPISLLDEFVGTNPFIQSRDQIETAWELENYFDTGVDAVLVYRDDRQTIANVIPGGGIQTLNLMEEGFRKIQPMFLAHGGVVMRESGNVVIAAATCAA